MTNGVKMFMGLAPKEGLNGAENWEQYYISPGLQIFKIIFGSFE